MKTRELVAMAAFAAIMVLMVLMGGCTTMQRLGITEDHIATGVQIALSRQGLQDAVTPAQIREVITIVKAHERLNEIGAEVERDAAVQARINEIVGKYMQDGVVVDPRTLAPDPADQSSVHPAHRITTWYGGVNMGSATIDPDYQLTVSPDGRNWSAPPATWRADQERQILFPAICALAYQRNDGTWVGGKYEWLPRPPRERGYNNIRAGYEGWVSPPSGAPIWLFAYTADGNRISTPVQSIWP